jgi:mRNA-degrading endonuclease RelE of RelBE toxin-antitoxin system
MVKETKFFRKQAKKAERMARAIFDAEVAASLSNLAEAYRKQADALKAKRKSSKKRCRTGGTRICCGDAPVPRDHRSQPNANRWNSAR